MEAQVKSKQSRQRTAARPQPIIIAGPCSAESEDQLLRTARKLAAGERTDFFRAGIWKPRTRPGNFEGVGNAGLRWLQRVKEETGMKTATEVANTTHVYEALKYGIDCLWIGARTTANPFATQEIADALQGADVKVCVKNPVNPDPALWLGAIERISEAGVKDIMAIHRGFSSYGKTRYRNVPQWAIPLWLKKQIPGLPILCDPSHIAGKRELVLHVSRRSLLLGFDGLMVEVHHNPSEALSDAAQQLTPEAFERLMAGKFRNSSYL